MAKLKNKIKNKIAHPAKIQLAYKVLCTKKVKPKMKAQIPQQQLKHHFSNSSKRQQIPANQRVWRKTIVRIKPKPKTVVPRLFRADRLTGLPVDYERTVSKIMHYVNPKLLETPSPEQLMEELLTRTLAGIIEGMNRRRCPQYVKHHMRTILKNHGSGAIKEDSRNDEHLSQFHCACKRRPLMPQLPYPTCNSKFNYNNLKIHSN